MAEDNRSLNDAEANNETSWYKAFGAGLASGIIKIPEGVISLGAELIDLGADSDTASSVEEFFDKINIFEDDLPDITVIYKDYYIRNLPIVKEELPGLRLSQYKEKIKKMWKISFENPKNNR